jgi:Protein of unknown function DUF262
MDVAFLNELYEAGRILLRPEFQRNSIWPTAAKSYLIDTLIKGRPVPLLFLQALASAQTGQMGYAVVDGQQRLAAIFDFLRDGFRLSGPEIDQDHRGRRFSELLDLDKRTILAYGLAVEELTGYSTREVEDVFVRLNKYGVRLSPQELRHAQHDGEFSRIVEQVGAWDFWTSNRVLTAARANRMRNVELASEFLILLAEGAPQDKKAVIDDYYRSRSESFPEADELVTRLRTYFEWLERAVPAGSRFFKPVDLYALVGALDRISGQNERLGEVDIEAFSMALDAFGQDLRSTSPSKLGARYLIAASRQTDNLIPRKTRLDVLVQVLSGSAR